jgi:hypothetical protein
MTGQEIQDRLDELVTDIETFADGADYGVAVAVRGSDNGMNIMSLDTSNAGSVNPTQLTAIQSVLDTIKPIADTFATEYEAVRTASEAFKTERAKHQTLIDAASAARIALNDALEADTAYQAAKTALDTARSDVDYVNARTAYKANHVSEVYGNLAEAKGNYVIN